MKSLIGIDTESVFVTPEQAAEWLAESNHGNRQLRSRNVSYLRREIEDGRWEHTHQGIAFYEDGTLADGQHRLTAIVEAGVGVMMNVTRGLSRSANSKIDDGLNRTKLDTLHFGGVKADNKRIAVCGCMVMQYECEVDGREKWAVRKVSSDQFQEFYAQFLEAIDFSLGYGAARTPAPVPAAIATAWFTQDRDRLIEFIKVLDTGEAFSVADRAAIRLKSHIDRKEFRPGHQGRNDLFLRTCAALRYFLARKPITKLYVSTENAFDFAKEVSR